MILQSEAPECGIACVAMVASYHGFRTDLVRDAHAAGAVDEGRDAEAHRDDRRDDGPRGPRREGRARIAAAAEAAGDPALGHEPLRRADEGRRRPDHGARPGARPARADPQGGVGPLHRRRDGADAGHRVRRARRAREDQRVAAGAHGDRAEGRGHAGAAAVAGAGSARDRVAVLPAARGRPRGRRPRPRPARRARHRIRAAGGDDRHHHGAAVVARRLHQHAAEPAAARHAVRAAAAAAARLVREAPHRRHRVALPQRRRDPAHADADLPRNGDGRRDGARHARGDVLVQRDADRRSSSSPRSPTARCGRCCTGRSGARWTSASCTRRRRPRTSSRRCAG